MRGFIISRVLINIKQNYSGAGQFPSPGVPLKSGLLQARAAGFLVRHVAVQPLVHAKTVIIALEEHQLSFQIGHVPNDQMANSAGDELYPRRPPSHTLHIRFPPPKAPDKVPNE